MQLEGHQGPREREEVPVSAHGVERKLELR